MGVGEKGVTEHLELHKKVGVGYCFPLDRYRLSRDVWLAGFFNLRSKNPSHSAGIQAQVGWLLLCHQVTRAPRTFDHLNWAVGGGVKSLFQVPKWMCISPLVRITEKHVRTLTVESPNH